MKEIKGFHGKYRFLSNFYPSPVTWEGLEFKSSEAAYQASKAISEEIRLQFTKLDAREARQLGKQIKLREDWEEVKRNVMYRILIEKFLREPLRTKLIKTEDAYLEETNYWHDTFWGVCNGEGKNHLGKLLMLVRDQYRKLGELQMMARNEIEKRRNMEQTEWELTEDELRQI